MFSALKFVTAGVVVALFGGFLLAVILTTQQGDEVLPAAVTESPSPITSEELLSGMVTEEVEPGVFRVLHDGVRDLSVLLSDQFTASLTTGHDGSVWLRSRDEAIRLGRTGTVPIAPSIPSFSVGPDGTVWVIDEANKSGSQVVVRSFDGETWTAHPAPSDERLGGPRDASLHFASDGTVLVDWPLREGGTLMTRLGADGWEPLPGTRPEGDLVTTDDGVIWAIGGISSYRDGQWQRHDSYEAVALSRDGSHWFVNTQPVYLERNLADGTTTCPTDDAPERFHPLGGLSATSDGSLWVIDTSAVMHSTEPTYRLARFDCAEWDYPLDDGPAPHVIEARITDDDSVWVLAGEEREGTDPLADMGPRQLYVITPEVVTGTE